MKREPVPLRPCCYTFVDRPHREECPHFVGDPRRYGREMDAGMLASAVLAVVLIAAVFFVVGFVFYLLVTTHP